MVVWNSWDGIAWDFLRQSKTNLFEKNPNGTMNSIVSNQKQKEQKYKFVELLIQGR